MEAVRVVNIQHVVAVQRTRDFVLLTVVDGAVGIQVVALRLQEK
jgi:hypothetical protein